MSYIGNFALGSTFDTKFCTVTTTGAPTTLAGTPVISAYVDNSVTQLTAGITLTVDFDAVTGLHNVRVVATGANGYAAGSNYQLVITTGTVGGTSVVGYVIAEFSIEARSELRPAVAGRTLAVDVSGNVVLQAVTHTGATVPTVTNLTNDAGITQAGADKVWASASRTLTAFSTALALSVWDVLESSIVTASSIGLKLKGFVFTTAGRVDASLRDWLGTPPSALIAGRVDANAQVVSDKTGYTIAAGGIGSGAHTATELNNISDAVLDRNMATGTDSGTDSTAVRTPRQALRVSRNKATVAAGVLTVRKEDDVTASFTAAITTTAGNPISEVDPT